MLDLHQHQPAHPIAAKPTRTRGKRRSAPDRPLCVVCGAVLASDHALGDLVCGAHPRHGYEPRHDVHLDEKILTLLWRANGAPLNLCRALGAEPSKSNQDAVQDAVGRINRRGFVSVRGYPHVGFMLAALRRGALA